MTHPHVTLDAFLKSTDDGSIPESRLLLTSPRAVEACLRCGIEPDELRARPRHSFYPQGGLVLDADPYSTTSLEGKAAALRHDYFNSARARKVEVVRAAYTRVAAEVDRYGNDRLMANAQYTSPRQTISARSTATSVMMPGKDKDTHSDKERTVGKSLPPPRRSSKDTTAPLVVDSTMVALEERRLDAIKARQEKEIATLVEGEAKMAALQKQNALREAIEMKKQATREKQRQISKAENAAAKRERECKLAREEEAGVRRRRDLAKRQAAREKKIAAEELRQEGLRQAEAKERELERLLKAEEHRQHTAALVKAQEDKAMANRHRMLEREAIVQEKMAMAQAARSAAAAVKSSLASARIQECLASNQATLAARKAAYHTKEALAATRTSQLAKEAAVKAATQRDKLAKGNKSRDARLANARKLQHTKVRDIQSRRVELDSHFAITAAARSETHDLKSVERACVMHDKAESVARIQRLAEYNRLVMCRKINSDDAKTRQIKEKKAALIEARKTFALASTLRKHQIAEAVEQMRVSNNWNLIDTLGGPTKDGPGANNKPTSAMTVGSSSPRS